MSGFWNLDIKNRRIFGDADTSEYFERTEEQVRHGLPNPLSLPWVLDIDRARVRSALLSA